MPSRRAKLARVCLCALALAPVFCARSAAAQVASVRVPEDCGSERELRGELERLLGPDSAKRALPKRLHIERAGGDYALELELSAESRSLRDPDCRALFKTAVVVAAAAIDPALLERAAGRAALLATVPPAYGPETAGGAQHPASAAPAREGPGAPWRAGAAIGAGGAFALVPRPSPLVELSGAVLRGRLGLGLAARYVTGAEAHAFGGDTYGVRVYGFGARLSALYEPGPVLRLAAGAALDRFTGRGLGSAVDDVSDSGLALALAVEAAVVPLRIGASQLSLVVSGQYALVRPSFQVEGRGEVYRAPALGATALLRLGWEFR